jgi:hypothetical protein
MEKLNIDDTLLILEKSEKPFNNMVDWHIAFIQEPDVKKQELYYAIYESKRKAYCELKKELFKQYEQ